MPPPFRVALISSGLGHELRGIELWMADLARHLPAEADVELWSGGKTATDCGARVVRRLRSIGRQHPIFGWLPWDRRYQGEQLTALPKALSLLRRQRISVAYCGDPILAWNLKRFRRWHGARVVFMNGMRLTPRWLKDYDGVHLLAPAYLREADEILPLAQAARFFVVPHFTDTVRFTPPSAEQRRLVRDEWQLPQQIFVVLTVGPVGSISGKRLDFLAQEVAAVPGAMLVSVGGDEDGADGVRARALAALGPRLRMVGRIGRDRIASLYHAADAYSLGSLAEPFSIAILEALASGLPVVHHRDEVMTWQTGAAGIPVDLRTQGGAADGFRALCEDPSRREELALAARELAVGRYAPEAVCAALLRELRRVAERPLAVNS